MKLVAYFAAVVTWIMMFFVALVCVVYIKKNGVGWGLVPIVLVESLFYLLFVFEHRNILKLKSRSVRNTGDGSLGNTGDGTVCFDKKPQ